MSDITPGELARRMDRWETRLDRIDAKLDQLAAERAETAALTARVAALEQFARETSAGRRTVITSLFVAIVSAALSLANAVFIAAVKGGLS